MRPLSGGLSLIVVAVSVVGSVSAQATGSGLTLDTVVQLTLERSAAIAAGRREVEISHGELLVARAAFDIQLRSRLLSARETFFEPAAVQSDLVNHDPLPTNSTIYELGAEKRFRAGIVVTPSLSITRTAGTSVAGSPVSDASGQLDLMVPLSRDRGGAGFVAVERAADAREAATRFDLQQVLAINLLTAAVSYWGYVAALERLGVYLSTEERAQELVKETVALVQADERPASDLQQVRANLASKRATRIVADQAVVSARAALSTSLGTRGDDPLLASRPTTPLPTPPPSAQATSVQAASLDAAVARRPDWQAVTQRRAAYEHQLQAATNELRPTLNLVVGAGYVGRASGTGLGSFVGALYRHVPGFNSTIELRYEWPVGNRAAQGRAMQSQAALEQQQIEEEDLTRRIATNVLVAHTALRHGEQQVEAASEAVTLSQQTVESERGKFHLGVGTLFDVTLAEDYLTEALLQRLEAKLAYGVALAQLRYELGLIVPPDNYPVEARVFLQPPDAP